MRSNRTGCTIFLPVFRRSAKSCGFYFPAPPRNFCRRRKTGSTGNTKNTVSTGRRASSGIVSVLIRASHFSHQPAWETTPLSSQCFIRGTRGPRKRRLRRYSRTKHSDPQPECHLKGVSVFFPKTVELKVSSLYNDVLVWNVRKRLSPSVPLISCRKFT